jgi:hypothetical protein
MSRTLKAGWPSNYKRMGAKKVGAKKWAQKSRPEPVTNYGKARPEPGLGADPWAISRSVGLGQDRAEPDP